ncbi:TPA: hypothetical protein HA274_03425 [Candidatus Bathyarchaeota archaeon]|nr:hypothetical protein [Candidatus Bathyarchaeota archaeon]
MFHEDVLDKPAVVQLILSQKTEEALDTLAKQYKVSVPNLKVGLPKGHKKKVLACYTPKNQTIFLSSSDVLGNPFVILHEFYHHTRTSVDRKHKGAERNADQFANDFIKEYRKTQTR